MINVATVNTKGISEDLSLIVKCCQIMVSEMMCQLLKLNNPCWSAVSDYNTDQRRGLIGTRKPRLGGYETDNLHGSGVIDQTPELWLGMLTPLALGATRGWGPSWGHVPGCWCGRERIDGSVFHGHVSEAGRLMQLPARNLLILAGESLGAPGWDSVALCSG